MSSDQKNFLDGRRVLVADDEPFNLSIVVRMMREFGCRDVATAANGTEALQLLNGEQQPYLSIIDFNMPSGNGLQVLKSVRTGKVNGTPRDLRMVMLTGSSDFSLVGAAMALDIDAFLIKPVSVAAMAGRLTRVLQQTLELKPVEHYEQVDIDGVGKRLLANKPVGLSPQKRAQAKPTGPKGLPVKLYDVQPGAVLSEPIRSKAGELLIGAATVLTERLIARLHDLQPALNIDYLYVFPPAADKSKKEV